MLLQVLHAKLLLLQSIIATSVHYSPWATILPGNKLCRSKLGLELATLIWYGWDLSALGNFNKTWEAPYETWKKYQKNTYVFLSLLHSGSTNCNY